MLLLLSAILPWYASVAVFFAVFAVVLLFDITQSLGVWANNQMCTHNWKGGSYEIDLLHTRKAEELVASKLFKSGLLQSWLITKPYEIQLIIDFIVRWEVKCVKCSILSGGEGAHDALIAFCSCDWAVHPENYHYGKYIKKAPKAFHPNRVEFLKQRVIPTTYHLLRNLTDHLPETLQCLKRIGDVTSNDHDDPIYHLLDTLTDPDADAANDYYKNNRNIQFHRAESEYREWVKNLERKLEIKKQQSMQRMQPMQPMQQQQQQQHQHHHQHQFTTSRVSRYNNNNNNFQSFNTGRDALDAQRSGNAAFVPRVDQNAPNNYNKNQKNKRRKY